MDVPTNPLAILTFVTAPAVLTNASCVLLFGTGNRYGRAIDRVHQLAEMIEKRSSAVDEESRLRIRQLAAGEARAVLIVRALTCFYIAVAGFVTTTLVSLIGALLASVNFSNAAVVSFSVAFLTGAAGVLAIVLGALMLALESRYSLRVLRDENKYLTARIQDGWAAQGNRAPHQGDSAQIKEV